MKVGFLFFSLPLAAAIGWISADVGLPAFILEIDLGLIERGVKQIIGIMLDAGSRGRAVAQPVEPQRVTAGDPVLRVERQKLCESFLLPSIEHVALKLRDDEREAGDLGRKVAQLDASEIRKRDFSAVLGLAAPLVDLGLDLPHRLV